jgi:hypothetical protein
VAPKTISAWLAIELNPMATVTPTAISTPLAPDKSYPQSEALKPLLLKSSLNNGVAKQFSSGPSLMGPALVPKIENSSRKTPRQAPTEQIPLIAPAEQQAGPSARSTSNAVATKVWRHDQSKVVALRELPITETLKRLGLYFKADVGYVPKDSAKSERLHVTLQEGQVIELVYTGLLWFDKTREKGAFGSIDLAMYLMNWSVREALSKLHVK